MDNLLTVAFEAHNAEKNHHRRYQVTLGRDLLDDWTVAIRYGRTGQGGREIAIRQPEGRRYASRDSRPAPPTPVGPETDRLPLPPGCLQCGTGLRCRILAAGRGHGQVLSGGVIQGECKIAMKKPCNLSLKITG